MDYLRLDAVGRPTLRFLWSLLPLLLAAGAGCGDEELIPTAPETPSDTGATLTVSVTVRPSTIVPGMTTTVTATATIADTDRIVLFRLSVAGLGGDTTFNLPVLGKGTLAYSLELSIVTGPIAGQLDFTAFARTPYRSDSAQAALTIQDDGPPWISMVAPDTLALPGALELEYEAGDAAGITELSIEVGGVAERDTMIAVDYAPNLSGVFRVPIPDSALPGDSLSFRITTMDGFRNSTVDSGVVWLADSTPPSIALTIDEMFHAGFEDGPFGIVYFPGDTVRLQLEVADNHSLAWYGYRMHTLGDSMTTTAIADTAQFEWEIPIDMNTPDAWIKVFAVDSSGNVSEDHVVAAVMDGVQRPIEAIASSSFSLGSLDGGVDWELDVDRDVLYVTWSRRVHMLGLSPLVDLTPIEFPFPSEVRSIDRLPGTDTLVTLVTAWSDHLFFWDMNSDPSNLDSIAIDLPGNCRPSFMQVAANGYALMSGYVPSSQPQTGCPLVKMDVRTGELQTLDAIAPLPYMTASGDLRSIILWNDEQAAVYTSDTDSFGPERELFEPTGVSYLEHAGPSLDYTGANVLIRNRLYNSDLTDYRWLLPDPWYNTRAHALTEDGQFAYIGNWPGYWKIDVATGTVLEQVLLPRVPTQLIAHPDGRRLIVASRNWMGVVDLR